MEIQKLIWNFAKHDGNGKLLAEMEIKTEHHLSALQTRKRNFCFRLIWISFCLRFDLHASVQLHDIGKPNFQSGQSKTGDHIISSCIQGGFPGSTIPIFPCKSTSDNNVSRLPSRSCDLLYQCLGVMILVVVLVQI
jgi:hypothetical protein